MKHKLTDLKLLQKSKTVTLTFEDGAQFALPCNYLRINSPSAEVRGHNPQVEIKQLNKESLDVNIIGIDPIGNYADKLTFDDGHDTGLFSWDYFYELGKAYLSSRGLTAG